MHLEFKLAVSLLAVMTSSFALAQNQCSNGISVEGIITDPSSAVIAGAHVQAASGESTVTDTTGHFLLRCLPANRTTITVLAQGFAPGTAGISKKQGLLARVNLQLEIARVNTEIRVGDDPTAPDAGRGAATATLNSKRVQQLADDPDDFLRELQTLAASGGGDPSAATVVVDGFQNASALPPKNSIASIRIDPDTFSPQYEVPAWSGGRIEITTKAGADSVHGALFLTNSDGSFNATDPFSITATPAGKRRYGFELSGPIVPKKADFALALEKRDIDEFEVVNATTLDSNYNPVPLHQTVSAPQRLWIASARGDWQLTSKDTATISLSANVSNLGNQGVGGLILSDAGYSSLVSEYDLRLSNTQTLNSNVLHETRVGYSWKRTQNTPNATAASLQVAGYFTGGGNISQNLNNRDRDLEVDDDVVVTHGKHNLQFGAQSLGSFVHDYDPNTFNGAYVFGGGGVPVLDANNSPTAQMENITPIEQYRRALLKLPGGSPTTYEMTNGTPLVSLTEWRLGLYLQDDDRLTPHLTLSGGIRYQLQTTPDSFANFRPRLGLSWSPDRKETWVIHLGAGLFTGAPGVTDPIEVYRLNGVRQRQITVYSPNYNDPLTVVPGSIQVTTVNQFSPHFKQVPNLQLHAVVEHDFPHHWHVKAGYNFGGEWETRRIVNINAPMVTSNTGAVPDPIAALLAPRPIAPNKNIMQYQTYGHYRGAVYVVNVEQHSYQRLTLDASYWYLDFRGNPTTPQSTYSSQGDSGRPDWLSRDGVSFLGNVVLPYKINVSTELEAVPGRPYNITTGTDANGDGDFNDRPSYAASSGPGVYDTRFGLLTTNTVNGNVPYNLGTMPSVIHLDANMSRSFILNPKNKDRPLALTFNARSANVLNHTNVTAVNTVLSSSNIGQAIAAETARRLDLGVRFSF